MTELKCARGGDLIREWVTRQRSSYWIDLLREYADEPLRSEHEVFVLSASTRGDDANQWRLYTDNGRGYAIELTAATALAVCTNAPGPSRTSREPGTAWAVRASDSVSVTPWFRVIYDPSDTRHVLAELVRSLEFHERRIARDASNAEQAEFEAGVLKEDAYDTLATIAHLVKTGGFAGENEVRVVATFFAADEHVAYRAGAYGIVGYAELATAPRRHAGLAVLRPDSRPLPGLPIRSIRLGPLLGDEQQRTVEAVLRKYAYGRTTVERSSVPLR